MTFRDSATGEKPGKSGFMPDSNFGVKAKRFDPQAVLQETNIVPPTCPS